jgi:hypothetical protein
MPSQRARLRARGERICIEYPTVQYPPNVLRELVHSGTRPWSAEQVALSGAVTGVLWGLLVLNAALAGWALAVLRRTASCSGWPCWMVTLGSRPGLLLALSGLCAVSLAAAALATRGLSRAGAGQLFLIIVGGSCGVVAPLGVVALLTLTLAAVSLAAGLYVFVVERM